MDEEQNASTSRLCYVHDLEEGEIDDDGDELGKHGDSQNPIYNGQGSSSYSAIWDAWRGDDYEQEHVRPEQKSQIDDDGYEIEFSQHVALPIGQFTETFGPEDCPTTGEEYLCLVQHERSQIPSIITTMAVPTFHDAPDLDQLLTKNPAWCHQPRLDSLSCDKDWLDAWTNEFMTDKDVWDARPANHDIFGSEQASPSVEDRPALWGKDESSWFEALYGNRSESNSAWSSTDFAQEFRTMLWKVSAEHSVISNLFKYHQLEGTSSEDGRFSWWRWTLTSQIVTLWPQINLVLYTLFLACDVRATPDEIAMFRNLARRLILLRTEVIRDCFSAATLEQDASKEGTGHVTHGFEAMVWQIEGLIFLIGKLFRQFDLLP